MNILRRPGKFVGRARTRDSVEPFLRGPTVSPLEQLAPSPPQDIKAEQCVLGSILIDNKLLPTALQQVQPSDFFHDFHRRIFIHMIALGEAQQPIDLVTLRDQLRHKGELEKAGGVAYLAQLVDGVPRVSNVEHYARIVKKKSLLRGTIVAMQAIQQTAQADEEDPDALLDQAAASIDNLRGRSTTKRGLVVHDLTEFRKAEFPAREPFLILEPHNTTIYSARSLNQIFAWRGTGKTMFSFGLAGAFATGGEFLCWRATRKIKTIYVEGESPNAQLQERANLHCRYY